MRLTRWLAEACAPCAPWGACCAQQRRPPPTVELRGAGTLVGTSLATNKVAAFLAVPYAAKPAHQLRWRPPTPHPPWHEPRSNPRDLARCPQPATGWNDAPATFRRHRIVDDEDCLHLNVFCPMRDSFDPSVAEDADREGAPLLPIVFYVHGGAGKLGTCHDEELSGRRLAQRQRVVYVAPNYRLGALGFLAHPALAAEDAAAAAAAASGGDAAPVAGCGSYAVLDLIAALTWVRQHGASFGGDVDNVTIWGLSTGAQLVATLLVSPAAGGLFHRAVVQSCTDLVNERDLSVRHAVWRQKSAQEWGCELGEHLECGTAGRTAEDEASQLSRMRRLPVESLVDASWDEPATDCYEPLADRRPSVRAAKPATSLELLRRGEFARVPLLLGVTDEDGLGKSELELCMFDEVDTVGAYEHVLARHFGDAAAAARSHYPAASDGDVEAALGALSNDIWYDAGTLLMAKLVAGAERPPPVFLYRVGQPGFTHHGSDTPLWNGNFDLDRRGGRETPGAAAMAYLGNFARTGDPSNGAAPAKGEASPLMPIRSPTGRIELPPWEPFRPAEAPRYMRLGPTLGMVEGGDFDAKRLHFIMGHMERWGDELVERVTEAAETKAQE